MKLSLFIIILFLSAHCFAQSKIQRGGYAASTTIVVLDSVDRRDTLPSKSGTFAFRSDTGRTATVLITGGSLKKVVDSLAKYKVYSALLNQSGTSAPTATVLENTMGETFTFAYDDVGRFILTSPSNKFISNKTFMVNGNPIISEGVTGEIALSVASTSAIIIKTTEVAAGAAKNGVLINSPIEIRVYN